MKTPVEIIAGALFNDSFGGTSDPDIENMIASISEHTSRIAINALEAEGWRIVHPDEVTEEMSDAYWKAHDEFELLKKAQQFPRPRKCGFQITATIAAAPKHGSTE